MILSVPFYSQHKDVFSEEWRSKSCAIVCLKMALDFLSPQNGLSTDDLIKEGEIIQNDMIEKGYMTGEHASNGWSHDVIVFISHNHGILAYREEFRSIKVDKELQVFTKGDFEEELETRAIQKITQIIEKKKPVIISIKKPNGSFHTVLVVGFESNHTNPSFFFYHDPDTENGGNAEMKVSITEFLKIWRRLAIFIG